MHKQKMSKYCHLEDTPNLLTPKCLINHICGWKFLNIVDKWYHYFLSHELFENFLHNNLKLFLAKQQQSEIVLICLEYEALLDLFYTILKIV